MEIKKVSEVMRNALRAPLPSEAVTQHPTKTYLSSIKAIYVIERLNDVFGIGNWSYSQKVVERADGGVVVVEVNLLVPEYGISHTSFGGNDNGGESSKNFDLGDAYKGAVTDAITKICSMLEIGIDVFKGLQTGKGGKSNKTTISAPETAPWLTEAQYNEAIKQINNGEKGLFDKLYAEYRMKKAYRTGLQEAEKKPLKMPETETKPKEKAENKVKAEILPDTAEWAQTVVWLSKRDEMVFDSFEVLRRNYVLDKQYEERLAKEAGILRKSNDDPSIDEKAKNMVKQEKEPA